MAAPYNLIPTKILQLQEDPAPSVTGWMPYVNNGITYKVQVNALLGAHYDPVSGAFYDTVDQSALANTATALKCNTTALSAGVIVEDQTKFRVSALGTYNIQFSAQLLNADNSEHNVSIWCRKNGTDVPDSCTDITVPRRHGQFDGAAVAAWNFFERLNANEYVELMWSTPSTNVSIAHTNARTNPVRPAVPSLIVTVNKVDNGS